MNIRFWKAYAEGNSYVIVQAPVLPQALLPWIADHRRGLGGDGLLLADWGDRGAVGMRIFNADGTEAPACGNGARCVAALAIITGRVAEDQAITVQSPGARIVHRLQDRRGMTLALTQTIALQDPVRWEGGDVVQLDLGTAHRVVFCDLHGLDPGREGPRHALNWSGSTNVMFTQVVGVGRLDVVPWERGVGPTLGCATGAAAAAIAAAGRAGGWPDTVVVRQPGGTIQVRRQGGSLDITGTVRFIAEGMVTAE